MRSDAYMAWILEGKQSTRTVIKNGDDEDHEGSKIEFPDQGNKHKAKHNTDGDGNCINLV